MELVQGKIVPVLRNWFPLVDTHLSNSILFRLSSKKHVNKNFCARLTVFISNETFNYTSTTFLLGQGQTFCKLLCWWKTLVSSLFPALC